MNKEFSSYFKRDFFEISAILAFIKENNYNIKLNYGAFPDRPYDSLAVWGDNTKILQIMKENEGN